MTTFTEAPLQSRKVEFLDSGFRLGFPREAFPRRAKLKCSLAFTPPIPVYLSGAFPKRFKWVGFPESFRKETSCGMNFEIVAIPYVQASWFVRHPGLPCRCVLTSSQDSCDFYTRANHASSPMHASGMLAVYRGN